MKPFINKYENKKFCKQCFKYQPDWYISTSIYCLAKTKRTTKVGTDWYPIFFLFFL